MAPKATFLIAAPTSGSGKTTIARGLMALFTQKGYKVQPFKCGPDYIDTKFHEAVCGRPSINLDTFMASPEHVRELFAHYGEEADICIVEGLMGLFDGYDRERGSAYEIAKVLDIPVILVVDAKSAAYSMAALLSGFINFRKDIRMAGIIYNKVGSSKHFEMLKQVCEDLGIECFGYLPKNPSLEQGSRYLGLDFSEKTENQELIRLLEEHVNWEGLTRLKIPTLGIKCSHTGNKTFPYWEYLVALLVSIALIVAMSFSYQSWLWVPAFIVIGTIALVKVMPNWMINRFVWVGSISAAMFVAHPIVRKIFINVARRQDAYDGLILYIVATIALSWLFKLLIDRIPHPKL